jgi:hypothetical protein
MLWVLWCKVKLVDNRLGNLLVSGRLKDIDNACWVLKSHLITPRRVVHLFYFEEVEWMMQLSNFMLLAVETKKKEFWAIIADDQVSAGKRKTVYSLSSFQIEPVSDNELLSLLTILSHLCIFQGDYKDWWWAWSKGYKRLAIISVKWNAWNLRKR